ncbi:MAG TPA: hypothetical protein VE631_08340 [Alphaproteobacteria bacterium]|nr:hypothetical protein [Alphaproteobacteria bacterium]
MQRTGKDARPARREGAERRRERRLFFRAWLGMSIVASIVIAVLAVVAQFEPLGREAAGLFIMAVNFMLLGSALAWLVRYVTTQPPSRQRSE